MAYQYNTNQFAQEQEYGMPPANNQNQGNAYFAGDLPPDTGATVHQNAYFQGDVPPNDGMGMTAPVSPEMMSPNHWEQYMQLTPQQQADFQARFPNYDYTNGGTYSQQQPTVADPLPPVDPVVDALPPVDPTTGLPPSQNYDNSPISGSNPYSPWTSYGDPNYQNNNYSSDWNGNPTAGAVAGAADYAGVQDFSDAAYENARRYLDPQQAFDNRRFDQELINRGIDPMSDYGKQMYAEMMRAHGDQDQGAAYGAMEFGQGIQEQMFRQNYDNTRQAGDMQRAQWADQSNRYAADAGYKVGMGNLELGRQKQDFDEMGYYDARDYRNQLYNDSRNDRYQNIAMWMAGQGSPESSWGGAGNIGTSPWGEYVGDLRKIWK